MILYVPLDERPCNYIYPQYLAEIGGVDYDIPPYSILGKKKLAADTEQVWAWIMSRAQKASHLVLSMDMLVYGGIVPSRLHHLSGEVCVQRIERLRELKKINPKLIIYAFQLISRAPARNGSGEEPDYYEEYGYDIHRYGVVTDMESVGVAGTAELEEKSGILSRIPQNFLDDFIARRKVNFESNVHTICLAEDGVLDFLVIPLDDCKEYGYAPAERKQLAKIMVEKSMLSKIAMYPGADEMGCTLMARAIASLTGVTPKLWADYSSNSGMLTIPSYEDRSIGETTPYHILSAGGEPALELFDADVALMINPPTKFSQRLEKEWITDDILLETERNLKSFTERIKSLMHRGIDCFVADSAIPNGADRTLMQFLYEQNLLDDIRGYAGWNTSSNTMGTVVGYAIAYSCAKQSGGLTTHALQKSREFLFLRYMEDWGYMAEVRRPITENLSKFGAGLTSLDLKGKEPNVAEETRVMLSQFQQKFLPQYQYAFSVGMPWNRMFEIELTIKKDTVK